MIKNRHYIKAVINVLLLCCKQEIALRGHDESEASSNRGKFLEILHLVARHDKSLMRDYLSVQKMLNIPHIRYRIN